LGPIGILGFKREQEIQVNVVPVEEEVVVVDQRQAVYAMTVQVQMAEAVVVVVKVELAELVVTAAGLLSLFF
jgi:hypothetical protein